MNNVSHYDHHQTRSRAALLRWIFYLSGCALLLSPLAAQTTFSSGSTGALGAFDPTQPITIELPPDGVLNYTTVNIRAGVTVTFKRNAANTPVTLLATGDVKIGGRIVLSGERGNAALGGEGGPGGFRGGNGGISYAGSPNASLAGTAGDGPGGGAGGPAVAGGGDVNSGGGGGFATAGGSGYRGGLNPGAAGLAYGTATLLPLIGGSGGGGGSAGNTGVGGGGGGGGGALLIASSGKIVFQNGGDNDYGIYAGGGPGGCATVPAAGGSGGAGGAIRLVANEISGDPWLDVSAGNICTRDVPSNVGGYGFLRTEGFNLTEFRPRLNSPLITRDAPKPVTLTNGPQLRILSVGGKTPPTPVLGSLYREPDIKLDDTAADTLSVPVQIEARNMPLSTNIQLTLIKGDGSRTTINTPGLTGTTAVATTSPTITLQEGETVVLLASTTLNALLAQNLPKRLSGERVQQVELAATYGGVMETTYITTTGRRIRATE